MGFVGIEEIMNSVVVIIYVFLTLFVGYLWESVRGIREMEMGCVCI